jgi:alanyl-tRNA synthetase
MDVPVRTRETTLEQARAEGVLAIFGEKYGERVRVVEIDGNGRGRPFSAELCGGTHVHDTGEIGGLFIISEGSIGSGLRRIEALTGAAAERWIAEQIRILDGAARRLGVNPWELEQKIVALQEELAAERRRAEALEREAGRRQAHTLAQQAETIGDAKLVVGEVRVAGVETMREIADEIKRALGRSLIILGAVLDDRPQFLVMAHELDERVHAGNLVREIARVAGGGGGGPPRMAQGGGRDPTKLAEALALGRRLAREQLARGHGRA